MGIDTHSLQLLRYAKNKYGDLGNTVALGRLAVLLGPRARRKWANTTNGCWAEPLLKEKFGAGATDSIDNSDYEGATIVADFNDPVSDEFKERYDTVLDFGCSEHIFDVAQSLRNIASLCKMGGRILHAVPSSGLCGHGFYQFSPELFFSWYSPENGFSDTEVFLADFCDTRNWYRVNAPKAGERVNIRSSAEIYVLVLAKRTGTQHKKAQQSDYSFIWQESVGKEVESRSPGRLATLREFLYQWPLAARFVSALDAWIAANGAKSLRNHGALTRIPLPAI